MSDTRPAFKMFQGDLLQLTELGDYQRISRNRARALLMEQVATIAELEQQIDEARKFASTTATGMWEEFYKRDNPNWHLGDSLIVILTQINNMIIGLCHSKHPPQQSVTDLQEQYRRDEVCPVCCQFKP